MRHPESDPLETYFHEIEGEAGLTKERERELLLLATKQTDDPEERKRAKEARDELVTKNLRFVVYMAKKHLGKGLEFDDLIEEGNLGLIEAVSHFDLSYDTRFITLAGRYILKHILLALEERLIYTPRYVTQLVSKYRKASLKVGSDPDTIANAIGLKRGEREAVKDYLRIGHTLSLGEFTTDERPEEIFGQENDPGRELEEEDEQASMQRALRILPEREREIIQRRFLNETQETLKEIGESMGMVRERVRQLQETALAKLHKFMSHELEPSPS